MGIYLISAMLGEEGWVCHVTAPDCCGCIGSQNENSASEISIRLTFIYLFFYLFIYSLIWHGMTWPGLIWQAVPYHINPCRVSSLVAQSGKRHIVPVQV